MTKLRVFIVLLAALVLVPAFTAYSQEAVLTISDVGEFMEFRDSVNNGKSFAGEEVLLDADIDLSGETWIPIGTGETPFAGKFNGGNHTISGLRITTEVMRDLTVSDMKKRFTGEITMSPTSLVYIDGTDVTLENVSVDGALIVRACPQAKVVIRNMAIQNKGWKFEHCASDPSRSWESGIMKMMCRYTLRKIETTEYIFNEPGCYVIE